MQWSKRKIKKIMSNEFYTLKEKNIKNEKIINIGLIGCGIVGIKRINNLPKKFSLIACSDIKKENFKNFPKKNIFLHKIGRIY